MLIAFRALAAALVAALALSAPAVAKPKHHTGHHGASAQIAKLVKGTTVKRQRQHLRALQAIADANGGIRASGTSGFAASRDYVVRKLKAAGYKPKVQAFDFPFFQELTTPTFEQVSPTPKAYTTPDEFVTMDYSGSGDVTAPLQEVADNQFPPGAEPSSSSAGCEPEDFQGFTAGNIALIQRGTCDFAVKAQNAEAAGAKGVVIFNEGQPGREEVLAGTLGGSGFTVPVLGTSFAQGQAFHDQLASGPVTVHIVTSTKSETRETYNVIADTKKGDADKTQVVGSHLDSVVKGPGINDNGTGSAFNLALAESYAKQHIRPRNRVRFAFWGAEEEGTLGSEHYVETLSAAAKQQIALNLNFDMIGSPNYVRFVYDGDGSGDPDAAGPAGSAQIEQVFLDYFQRKGLETEPTPFDGRSDYGAFIAEGIPAGGLFTGAENEKTPEEQAIYGGQAGVAYDHCYHQACDTFDNVNFTAVRQMSRAAAFTSGVFAFSKKPVVQTTAPTAAKRRQARAKARKQGRRTVRQFSRHGQSDR